MEESSVSVFVPSTSVSTNIYWRLHKHVKLCNAIIVIVFVEVGHAVAMLIEAVCYEPEGGGFDSQ